MPKMQQNDPNLKQIAQEKKEKSQSRFQTRIQKAQAVF